MTNPKHTPGPWSIFSHPNSPRLRPKRLTRYFEIAPKAGPALAILPEGRADIQEVNARLIAAAPDLLEALKGAYDEIRPDGPPHGTKDPLPKIRAAIDKAEGRTE